MSANNHLIGFAGIWRLLDAGVGFEQLGRLTSKPVLNAPEKIARLTRAKVAALLQSAAGVFMPATARVDRTRLLHAAHRELAMDQLVAAGRFPVIVRPIDSHGGKN